MSNTFESIQAAADGLRSFLPKGFEPRVGIICGSGLSGIAEAINSIEGVRDEISYSEIKGFPVSTGMLIVLYMGTEESHGIFRKFMGSAVDLKKFIENEVSD